MTPAEAQILLGMASTIDNRKPDESGDAAKAWAAMLRDLRIEDCQQAVVEHYTNSSEWLMPAMIRTIVKRIRSKRVSDHPPLTPPPAPEGLDSAAEVRWQIEWLTDAKRRIGDGEVIDSDAAYGELKPRHLPDMKALMASPENEAQEGAA